LFVEIEIVRPVLDERVDFAEGAAVEEQVDPFAGGQPSLRVLCIDPVLTAAEL
jgi:hypothetical protein